MYSGASLVWVWVNDLRFFLEALNKSGGAEDYFACLDLLWPVNFSLLCLRRLETGDWQCILRGIPRTWEVAA